MNKGRLEAFSDGVLAVIITIMVLELKRPDGPTYHDILLILPSVGTYLISFIFIGIYWNNHHHLLHSRMRVSGAVLWANLHLLFWLSLVPPVTAWLAMYGFQPLLVAIYAFLQLMAGLAYFVLGRMLVSANGPDSELARAIGKDFKGKISVVAYALAIGLAWVSPLASCAIIVGVALYWLVPDRRIERQTLNLEVDA